MNHRTSQKSPLRYMDNKQKQIYNTQRRPLNMSNLSSTLSSGPNLEQQRQTQKLEHHQKINKLTNTVLEVFQKNYVQYSP